MNKRVLMVLCAVSLVLCISMSSAFAGTQANSAFSSTEVIFTSSMFAEFSALTTKSYPKITVSVTLQRKEGTSWVNERPLPAPTFAASNTTTWGTTKNYSSYGTVGETYRLKAIFNAEGVTTTAYSVAHVKNNHDRPINPLTCRTTAKEKNVVVR